jgi:DNA-binding CsgD family transcriptional regulator
MERQVIGREHELQEGRRFLEAVAGGSRVLLLAGEPGVGKSTIWSTIAEEARECDFRVLVARPSEAEAELPFAVLTDLLSEVGESVLADLPDVQATALQQALRRRAISAVVDPTAVALATFGVLSALAGTAGTVVAIDDLHWVDAPSMRALTFALRRLENSRVGLLAATRPATTGQSRLEGVRPVEQVEIVGLGERELAALVLTRLGIALSPIQLRRLVELSGGNPLYALELAAVKDPEGEMPESLGAALGARLSSLSPIARGAGLVAAILGRIDDPLIERLHRGGLDELWSTGVLHERRGDTWFAHPLLASVLIGLHSPGERRAVHLSLAASLDDPDERALHLGRGSDEPSEPVAAELELAGTRVDQRGAPETAARLLERAAALTPKDDVAARTRRQLAASDLYQAAGEGREHVQPLLEALARSLPSGVDRARTYLRLGWLGAQTDVLTASESIAYEERALAESGGEPEVDVAAHAALARLLGIAGDYVAAYRHAELAVSLGVGRTPDLMFPSPDGELAAATFMTGRGFDEALYRCGDELGHASRMPAEPYQTCELQLGLGLLYTGDLARARTTFLRLRYRSEELGRIRSTAGCDLHLVDLEARAGRLDVAQTFADEFLHLDRQLRGDLSTPWYPTALVAVHLGRVEEARAILEEGIASSRAIESTIWTAHQLWALGHLELALGNLAEARSVLCEVIPMLRQTGLGEWSIHPVHPDAVEALVGCGDLDEAETLTAELEEYGRRLHRPWGLATAARSRALLEAARGDCGSALERMEEALREHDRLDWPLEQGRTLLARGRILRRSGRRSDAAVALAEARQIFSRIRSPLWIEQANAEAKRIGGRRRDDEGLTPAEHRVAQLAARGLRNAEIAAQLYVTPKTVETTLSRAYRKLGVRSRTELARNPQIDGLVTGDLARSPTDVPRGAGR